MKCILIRGKRLYPVEEEAIRRLVGFYGLQLDAVDVGSPDAVNRAISRLRSTDTLAVLTSQARYQGSTGNGFRRRYGGRRGWASRCWCLESQPAKMRTS